MKLIRILIKYYVSKIHFDLNCWLVLPQTQRRENQMKDTMEYKYEKKSSVILL